MSEYQDPPLRLTIEGMRWMGDDWEPSGASATFDLHDTDSGDSAEILRLLRNQLTTRLRMVGFGLSVKVGDLDFDAPDPPTETDMQHLEAQARQVLNSIEALRELAPEVYAEEQA